MVTTAVPTLTDGVVTLRAHRPSDAQRAWEQCQDPVSQAWTTVPIPYSMSDARQFVEQAMPAGWADNSEWAFAIEVDGEYGGTCSLRNMRDGRAEIAYGSHPAIRGTGAVGRALRLLVDWGFDQLELHVLLWMANRGNWASRRAAWRLGFSFDGTMREWLHQRGAYLDAWVGTLRHDDPRGPQTPWLTPPVLDGDGVRLRPFRAGDVPRIVEACSDPTTQHWLGRMASPYGEADARRYLEEVQEGLASGQELTWAVADPETDLAIGSMGIFHWSPRVECEIGYWTHPDARGRGLTGRAMSLATAYAFEELGVARVKALAAMENVASRRVIEGNGFRLSGVERLGTSPRDGRADAAIYDVLAEEWRAARSSTKNPARANPAPTSSGDR